MKIKIRFFKGNFLKNFGTFEREFLETFENESENESLGLNIGENLGHLNRLERISTGYSPLEAFVGHQYKLDFKRPNDTKPVKAQV